MKISENFKNRLKSLSGIDLNEVELRASSGRSGKNTLSFYVEEYLLNLGGIFLDELKLFIKENTKNNVEIKKTDNKITNNSIIINFQIEDRSDGNNIKEIDFSISFLVKLETDSNTVGILKYKNINDEFNLESKHSEKDIEDFIKEIVLRIYNLEKIS